MGRIEWFNERVVAQLNWNHSHLVPSYISRAIVIVCVWLPIISQKTFSFRSPRSIIAEFLHLPLSYHWDSPWNAIWRRSINFPVCKIACRCRFWVVTHSLKFWRHFCFFFQDFCRPHLVLSWIPLKILSHKDFSCPFAATRMLPWRCKGLFSSVALKLFSYFIHGREFEGKHEFSLDLSTKLDI